MEAVCRKHRKCHVTLFVLIWYVQIGSIIFLTLYHHHETHFCCPMLFCCFCYDFFPSFHFLSHWMLHEYAAWQSSLLHFFCFYFYLPTVHPMLYMCFSFLFCFTSRHGLHTLSMPFPCVLIPSLVYKRVVYCFVMVEYSWEFTSSFLENSLLKLNLIKSVLELTLKLNLIVDC